MVTILIVVTIATWAWNVSLWANPVGLVALAVILLVVGLVVLAVRINEQIDIWFKFKQIIGNFFGMIKWGIGIFIGLFVSIGTGVADIMEGPLFKLGLWISHFFKMVFYYVKQFAMAVKAKLIDPLVSAFKTIGGFIMEYLIDPIMGVFGALKEKMESLRNPLLDLIGVVKNIVDFAIVKPVMFVVNAVREVLGLAKKVGGGVKDSIAKVIGRAEGGYVQAMQSGGAIGGARPYLVGEKGPEIFMPSTAGKIIPNKDLNTRRVDKMLRSALKGMIGGGAKGQALVVENLEVKNLDVDAFNARKTAVAIDSFAGKLVGKKKYSSLFRR
tara:strand:- start:970 stop:1950 length:981 start_codon:yes stop_codon:yes gene_type:complete